MKTLLCIVALSMAMSLFVAGASAQDGEAPPAPVVTQEVEQSPSDVTPPPPVVEDTTDAAPAAQAPAAPAAPAAEPAAPATPAEGGSCSGCGVSACGGCQPMSCGTSCGQSSCRPARRCRIRFCRPRIRCGRRCGGC